MQTLKLTLLLVANVGLLAVVASSLLPNPTRLVVLGLGLLVAGAAWWLRGRVGQLERSRQDEH